MSIVQSIAAIFNHAIFWTGLSSGFCFACQPASVHIRIIPTAQFGDMEIQEFHRPSGGMLE